MTAQSTGRLERYLADEELDALSALAKETRLTLVGAPVATDGGLCVCDLDALVDVNESGVGPTAF